MGRFLLRAPVILRCLPFILVLALKLVWSFVRVIWSHTIREGDSIAVTSRLDFTGREGVEATWLTPVRAETER